MKNMQEFHKWLSSGNESSTPDQRRLEALTSVFEEMVMPAYKLFQAAGEAPADLSILEMMAGRE